MERRLSVRNVTIPWIEVSEIELFLVEAYLNGIDLLYGHKGYNIDPEIELIRCLANMINTATKNVIIIPAGSNELSVIEIC